MPYSVVDNFLGGETGYLGKYCLVFGIAIGILQLVFIEILKVNCLRGSPYALGCKYGLTTVKSSFSLWFSFVGPPFLHHDLCLSLLLS